MWLSKTEYEGQEKQDAVATSAGERGFYITYKLNGNI